MHALLIDLLLAGRNLRRHTRRSGLALAAIACGVAALLLAGGFIEWNFWHYRESMINSQLGHAQIHRRGYTEQGISDPLRFLLPEDAPEQEALASLSHVRTIAPRLMLGGLASFGDRTTPFVGEGVDPMREALFADALVLQSGHALAPSDAEGVLVGQGLARNLGLSVGDRLVLLANTRTGSLNGIEATVRGVFTSVSKAHDDVALRLPLRKAQELVRANGAHTWVVLLDHTDATASVTRRMAQVLATDQFEVVPWWQLSDFYNKSRALFGRQMAVMQAIIAILIVLSISNTLMMSVMGRISEIGTSMALGTTRAGILRRFLAEGFLLGMVGVVLGLLAGYGLSLIVSAIGIPVPPPPGMAYGYSGEILVTGELALAAAALGLGTALVASAYPAWRASRLQIVEALRQSRA